MLPDQRRRKARMCARALRSTDHGRDWPAGGLRRGGGELATRGTGHRCERASMCAWWDKLGACMA
eukprot:346789-Chlamydomonas_euryale.AAC.3